MPKLKIFSAPWCCNCKTVKMMLKDTPYETVSADEPETAPIYEKYEVMALPTVIAFDDEGKELKRWSGSFNKAIIEEIKTYG